MKHKGKIAILLSLVLILAGALLPHIWGRIQNASLENKVAFGSMGNVQLEFVQSDMPIRDILSIAARHTHSVEIPQDLAVHSSSDMLRIAGPILEQYLDAGLLPHPVDPETDTISILPSLLYEQSSSRKSNIFWEITFAPPGQEWTMTLTLDDRSGKVCSVSYAQDAPSVKGQETEQRLFEDPEAALETFRTLFLTQLGDEFSSPDNAPEETAISLEEGFASVRLSWQDSLQGDCHLVFYVLDQSFYTILY